LVIWDRTLRARGIIVIIELININYYYFLTNLNRDYHTKTGKQMTAVTQIVQDVSGIQS